jgi:1-deoxy-D-xylulose-5-phosphate synthase
MKIDLKKLKNPKQIKKLSISELEDLSSDIREFLINNISKTGGHLASNLGVVELTTALHYVFNSPTDKIIFDVGHQSYVHKILTGRAAKFDQLRKYGGLSGFQKRSESPHDHIEGGHTSTSIAAALGFAKARDLDRKKHEIVAVIGDGALTGGVAFEALNNIAALNSKTIIILNDNSWSISKNVGGLNDFLTKIRVNVSYNKAKQEYKELMLRTAFTKTLYQFSSRIKKLFKHKIISNIFTDLNIEYLGPVDGHDYKDLIRALTKAKNFNGSILVHAVTQKGKGYKPAETACDRWHGVSVFDAETGQIAKKPAGNQVSLSEIASSAVHKLMQKDKNIVAITPAMITGSKLEKIFDDFPERSIDTGITEQCATLLAHSLAIAGKKPFLSIYSSFLQRGYDQLNHDIARMGSHVVVGIDRAGLVGEDGETHHGVFDISFLRGIPNIILAAPKDAKELRNLIYTGFCKQSAPFFIRYERANDTPTNDNFTEIKVGTWEYLQKVKDPAGTIISYGPKILKIYEKFKDKNINIINARYIKPLDSKIIKQLAKLDKKIFIYETDIKAGGLGSAILEALSDLGASPEIKITGIGDHFVPHGTIDELLRAEKLDVKTITKQIKSYFK